MLRVSWPWLVCHFIGSTEAASPHMYVDEVLSGAMVDESQNIAKLADLPCAISHFPRSSWQAIQVSCRSDSRQTTVIVRSGLPRGLSGNTSDTTLYALDGDFWRPRANQTTSGYRYLHVLTITTALYSSTKLFRGQISREGTCLE